MESSFQSAHPRLFWSADEVAGLRAKADHPKMATLRDQVLEQCAGYVDPEHADFIDTSLNRTELVGVTHGLGHTWQKLARVILAAVLTDDERWFDLLADVLKVFTQDPSPMKAWIFKHVGGPTTHHDRSLLDGGPQKNLASQCGTIPLMLDLLWDRLASADRDAACAYLDREFVQPYLKYVLDAPEQPGYQQNLGINLAWWEFYPWVWSLAVLYDPANPRHVQGMQAAVRQVRLGMHLGTDEAGFVGEGPGYGSIEIFDWWTSAEVFRRMGVVDLWEQDERFAAIMKARVYLQFPDDSGIFDHGDTDRSSGLARYRVMLLHSLRTGDPVYQAAWDRLACGMESDGLGAGPHYPLGVLGYWLWYDPTIDPDTRPDTRSADWPTAPEPGDFGLHTVRTGWSADDMCFAFFTAGRTPGSYIHQHTDAGHFLLHARGETLTAGRGYGHTLSSYHNVLRVEGKEPAHAPQHANGESWRGGHTIAAGASTYCHIIAADLARQWDCCWYHRFAVVINLPGAEPYVALLDHCNPDNDWARFDWQFQVEQGHQVDLFNDEHRAVVRGKQARLDMGFAFLNAGEYPKPSTFELCVEQRQHIYADAAASHPHASGQTFECLIGRLASYTGVLLAALTPRGLDAPATRFNALHAPRQCGLTIDHGEVIDTIVANPAVRHLSIGGMDGEATLAVARRDREGRLLSACAADCFSLVIDGQTIAEPRGRARVAIDRVW